MTRGGWAHDEKLANRVRLAVEELNAAISETVGHDLIVEVYVDRGGQLYSPCRKVPPSVVACVHMPRHTGAWGDLDSLDLPVRVINALKRDRIYWLAHLRTLSDDDLLMVKGIGVHALSAIHRCLKRLGQLREDAVDPLGAE